jgi:hypothetical protein
LVVLVVIFSGLAACGGGDNNGNDNPVPVLSSTSPTAATASGPDFTLTVNGSGFVSASSVRWNGSERTTEFISSSQLTATIGAADIALAGSAQVTVHSPTPGGGTSTAISFAIENPRPTLSSLTPTDARVGSISFSLNVTGTGFVEGAIVTWDGADRSTDYVSATQVIAVISGMDLTTPRTVSVRVRNPDPTVGPSNSLPFVVEPFVSPEPSGFPVLISMGTDGSRPNGPSVNGGTDWEADHVIFASRASNLVPGDTNGAYDLFIRKTCLHSVCTPETIRGVLASDGGEPNGDVGWTSTSPEDSLAVSFSGRFVAFVSSASNLVAGDTNGVDDVFIVDLCINPRTACTPGVLRVSLRNDGTQSNFPASQPAVAGAGRYVVFVSDDSSLVAGDTNGVADVFLRDTCRGATEACTPSTTRVSVATNGSQGNGASGEPVFTGRYVAFSSLASNLVTGDSNGLRDVFLRDTCIAEPACTPSTRLVSVGHLGDPADGASSDPQVGFPLRGSNGYDFHGRFVAFVSAATNLVAGDSNGALDVFERDLCTGRPGCTPSTARISVTSAGGQISGDSWSPNFLRWDGETMPFVTAADGVVPGDTNGLEDVYVRHHCPFGAPDYCVPTTRRISNGAGGAQTDGDSYAPRMCNDPFGAWAITYISEASNLLPDAVAIPNDGSIYLDLAY